jgi:hypothetical protein
MARLGHCLTLGPAALVFVSGSFLTCFVAGALTLCSITKLFVPDRAGLWQLSEGLSLRMGFGSTPPNGTEILGWWIVPLGLTSGVGLVLLTFRLLERSRHWFQELRAH